MMNLNRLKKLSVVKDASIYTGANILSALVPFFCMPVLTRYLTPEDYGIVAIMGSIISFLTPFVGLNIYGIIAAEYYKNSNNFISVVKNCNSILLISSIAVSLLVYIFADIISEYTLFPGDWLWAVVVICICQYIFSVHLTLLQMRQKAFRYGLLQVFTVVLNTGLSIFLVVVLSMNWQGRVIAQTITVIVSFSVGMFYFYRNGILGIRFDKIIIRQALTFGVPLIPHSIAGSLLTVVDRFYVANFVDVGVAGLFVLGAQIGNGMELITSSINKAYVPWLYKQLKDIAYIDKCRIVRYTYVYFGCLLAFAAVYSFLMPIILTVIVGEKFYGAAQFVWPFALAGALNGMYYTVVAYIFYSGYTTQLMIRTLLVSLLHTALSYCLTSLYGVVGACWCVVISYAITFWVVWNLSNKAFKMPWTKIGVGLFNK